MAKQTIQVADKPTLDAILTKMNTMADTIATLSSKIENIENDNDLYDIYTDMKIKEYSAGTTFNFTATKPTVIHAIVQDASSAGNDQNTIRYRVTLDGKGLFLNKIRGYCPYVSEKIVNNLRGTYGGGSSSSLRRLVYDGYIENLHVSNVTSNGSIDKCELLTNKSYTSSNVDRFFISKGIYIPSGSTLKVTHSMTYTSVSKIYILYKELA